MKHVSVIAAGSTILFLVGCASPSPAPLALSQRVGPGPAAVSAPHGKSALQVYSARQRVPLDLNEDEFLADMGGGRNAFFSELAHTDYTICSPGGKVLQYVRNARCATDPEPAMVPLAPGDYEIKAEARGFGEVTVPVVIEAGKVTTVNLERNHNLASSPVNPEDLVWLGNNRAVGWKAPPITPAENP